MKIILSLLIFTFLTHVTNPEHCFADETNQNEISKGVVELDGKVTLVIPEGYSQYEPPQGGPRIDPLKTTFVRRGDCLKELTKTLLKVEIDKKSLDLWCQHSIRDHFAVHIANIIVSERKNEIENGVLKALSVPSGSNLEVIHQEFTTYFKSQWGPRAVVNFDKETGIGHYFNYIMIPLSLHIRLLGDKLIVIEGQDSVDMFKARKEMMNIDKNESLKNSFKKNLQGELWEFFKDAANYEVVEKVLLSAKPQ